WLLFEEAAQAGETLVFDLFGMRVWLRVQVAPTDGAKSLTGLAAERLRGEIDDQILPDRLPQIHLMMRVDWESRLALRYARREASVDVDRRVTLLAERPRQGRREVFEGARTLQADRNIGH